MPTLTAQLSISYGDSIPNAQVIPWRNVFNFSLTYTEESIKTVAIPANTTDFSITLDTVTAPKFVFMRTLDVDVTVKVSDGVVVTPTPTALGAASGWLMFVNPNGQPVDTFLVTTPASPTTGAHVQVLAFE